MFPLNGQKVPDITVKQDTLVSGQNIKTLNGQSLLGSGDVAIKTYMPFPDDFVTSGSLEQVVESILNSAGAIQGAAYLGGIEGSCTPFGYGNVECKVEFMLDYLALLTVSSSNISPYHWEYNTHSSDFKWRKYSDVIPNPQIGEGEISTPLTTLSIDGGKYTIDSGASSAEEVSYTNTESGLAATNVQDAIDEITTGGISMIDILDTSGILLSKYTPIQLRDMATSKKVFYYYGGRELGTGGYEGDDTTYTFVRCEKGDLNLTKYVVQADKRIAINTYPIVPAERTINGKALSSNITLSASDIPGATGKFYKALCTGSSEEGYTFVLQDGVKKSDIKNAVKAGNVVYVKFYESSKEDEPIATILAQLYNNDEVVFSESPIFESEGYLGGICGVMTNSTAGMLMYTAWVNSDTFESGLSGKISNPEGGAAGNVLKKTEDGVEWGAIDEKNYELAYFTKNVETGSIICHDEEGNKISMEQIFNTVSEFNKQYLAYYTNEYSFYQLTRCGRFNSKIELNFTCVTQDSNGNYQIKIIEGRQADIWIGGEGPDAWQEKTRDSNLVVEFTGDEYDVTSNYTLKEICNAFANGNIIIAKDINGEVLQLLEANTEVEENTINYSVKFANSYGYPSTGKKYICSIRVYSTGSTASTKTFERSELEFSNEGLATETWVEAKGYLTEHQSLSAYRTSAQQDDIDATKVDKVSGKGLSTNDYTNADKSKVGEIDNKADYDGYYESLSVGLSDNLIDRKGNGTAQEIVYRTSCGSDSVADDGNGIIQKIKGNTVVWNQLINPSKFNNSNTINGVTFTVDKTNGTVTVNGTATEDAKFVLFGHHAMGAIFVSPTFLGGCPSGGGASTYYMGLSDNIRVPVDFGDGKISSSYVGGYNFSIMVKSGITMQNKVFKPYCIDLTQMFGSGNEPTTVAQFKALFPLPYYAYNQGTLLNYNGTGLKTVGFNQLNPTDGKIKVIASQTYRIEGSYTSITDSEGNSVTVSNSQFTPSKNDTYTVVATTMPCIHLVWSGYRNGETEKHWTKTLPFGDGINTLTDTDGNVIFPDGMKSANSVSDELIAENGYITKGTKYINKVDLGTLTFTYASSQGRWQCFATPSDMKTGTYSIKANAVAQKYNVEAFGNAETRGGLSIYNSYIYVHTTDSTNAPSGWLYYETNEPTTYTLSTPIPCTYSVSDFGTEESLPTNTSTPTTTPLKAIVKYSDDFTRQVANWKSTKASSVTVNGQTYNAVNGNVNLGTIGGGNASNVAYDNTESGLEATNVQDGMDELSEKIVQYSDIDTTEEKTIGQFIFLDDNVKKTKPIYQSVLMGTASSGGEILDTPTNYDKIIDIKGYTKASASSEIIPLSSVWASTHSYSAGVTYLNINNNKINVTFGSDLQPPFEYLYIFQYTKTTDTPTVIEQYTFSNRQQT